MSNWDEALEALNADPALTVEQYTEWLRAGDGKFYDFFREYMVAIGRAEAKERIIKLLEGLQETFADPQYSTTGGYAEIFALKRGIALIKGKAE